MNAHSEKYLINRPRGVVVPSVCIQAVIDSVPDTRPFMLMDDNGNELLVGNADYLVLHTRVRVNRSGGSGWPWCAMFANNGELFDDHEAREALTMMVDRLVSFLHTHSESEIMAYPMEQLLKLGIVPIKRTMVKNEFTKEIKMLNSLWRLIQTFPIHHLVVMSAFINPITAALQDRLRYTDGTTPAKIGIGMVDADMDKLWRELSVESDRKIGNDVSGQDWSKPMTLHDAQTDVIAGIMARDGRSPQSVSIYRKLVLVQRLGLYATSDGCLYQLPDIIEDSGGAGTSVDNTVARCVAGSHVSLRTGGSANEIPIAHGDDGVDTVKTPIEKEYLRSRHLSPQAAELQAQYAAIGVLIKNEAEVTFLGITYNFYDDENYRYQFKHIAKLVRNYLHTCSTAEPATIVAHTAAIKQVLECAAPGVYDKVVSWGAQAQLDRPSKEVNKITFMPHGKRSGKVSKLKQESLVTDIADIVDGVAPLADLIVPGGSAAARGIAGVARRIDKSVNPESKTPLRAASVRTESKKAAAGKGMAGHVPPSGVLRGALANAGARTATYASGTIKNPEAYLGPLRTELLTTVQGATGPAGELQFIRSVNPLQLSKWMRSFGVLFQYATLEHLEFTATSLTNLEATGEVTLAVESDPSAKKPANVDYVQQLDQNKSFNPRAGGSLLVNLSKIAGARKKYVGNGESYTETNEADTVIPNSSEAYAVGAELRQEDFFKFYVWVLGSANNDPQVQIHVKYQFKFYAPTLPSANVYLDWFTAWDLNDAGFATTGMFDLTSAEFAGTAQIGVVPYPSDSTYFGFSLLFLEAGEWLVDFRMWCAGLTAGASSLPLVAGSENVQMTLSLDAESNVGTFIFNVLSYPGYTTNPSSVSLAPFKIMILNDNAEGEVVNFRFPNSVFDPDNVKYARIRIIPCPFVEMVPSEEPTYPYPDGPNS
jgi:hypothetical protein